MPPTRMTLLAPLLLAACAGGSDAGNQPPNAGSEPAATAPRAQAAASWSPPATVLEGLTRFSAALWRHVAERPGNQACSPLSIQLALTMAAYGARGDTLAQMERAIELPDPRTSLSEWADLIARLKPLEEFGKPVWTWSLANAFFAQQGLEFAPDFVACCQDGFHASVGRLDFQNHRAEAAAAINAHVSAQTHGLIPSIAASSSIGAGTSLVLATAMYFAGAWAWPFPKERTAPSPFHRPGQPDADVQTMHTNLHLGYAEVAGAQVVDLPYTMMNVECILVVPRALDGMHALERGLDGPALDRLCSAHLQSRLVSLALPKFHLEGEALDLHGSLASMGVISAFEPDHADFSGTGVKGLFLSAIVHRCVIDCDEQGTTAAAANGIVFRVGGIGRPEEPIKVDADHPFLLIIRHPETGAVLFIARVSDPTQG